MVTRERSLRRTPACAAALAAVFWIGPAAAQPAPSAGTPPAAGTPPSAGTPPAVQTPPSAAGTPPAVQTPPSAGTPQPAQAQPAAAPPPTSAAPSTAPTKLALDEPGPAAPTPQPALASPRLHHAPVSTAEPGKPLEITATLEHPNLVKYAGVVYRDPKGVLKAAPFLRSAAGGYAAVIPAEEVRPPGLAYAIELELVDGRRLPVFASRSAMHSIAVAEDRMDARERALFQRLDGRRSVVTASAEYVFFGKTTSNRALPCAPGQSGCQPGELKIPEVDDQFWRVEAGYTYRPLRTIAEFSLRLGVVRGKSLVGLSEFDESKYEVGLNYGAPTVRFRFADAWHMEVELLTSITEVGFSVGFGDAILIGDPYGSKLVLGFETIGIAEGTYFGSRFYSRMVIAASPRLMLSPMVEVTDMPHAAVYGVRLLGEASYALGGGFTAGLRAGYQARKSTSGGPSFGGHVSLAF